jgi:hypothetical protein
MPNEDVRAKTALMEAEVDIPPEYMQEWQPREFTVGFTGETFTEHAPGTRVVMRSRNPATPSDLHGTIVGTAWEGKSEGGAWGERQVWEEDPKTGERMPAYRVRYDDGEEDRGAHASLKSELILCYEMHGEGADWEVVGAEPGSVASFQAQAAAMSEPQPEPEHEPQPQAESTAFAIGAQVRVHGLIQAPQHNGRAGVVLSFVQETGRYRVKLNNEGQQASKSLGLKPANLTLLSDPPQEGQQPDSNRADEHAPEPHEELATLRRQNLELQAKLQAAMSRLVPEDRSDAGSSVFTSSTDQASSSAGPKIVSATTARATDADAKTGETQQLTLPAAASAAEPR